MESARSVRQIDKKRETFGLELRAQVMAQRVPQLNISKRSQFNHDPTGKGV